MATPAIDYSKATRVLDTNFAEVEVLSAEDPLVDDPRLIEAFGLVFQSKTESYREALLGLVLAKVVSPEVDVRRPYVSQGEDAFNGRTLDEHVVNPFLASHRIPKTTGPYLNVFRRQVQFIPETAAGLKDKRGFEAMLAVVAAVQQDDSAQRLTLLRECLRRFGLIRDAATVAVERVERLSLDQWQVVIKGLLDTPSGGLLPVLLVRAGLESLGRLTEGTWTVATQGINEADAARGAGGDITTRVGARVLDVFEVTERPIQQERVVGTFQNKMMPNGLKDYRFIAPAATVSPEAKAQAERYLAQGHEIEFADIVGWLGAVLLVLGPRGRRLFMARLTELLTGGPPRIRVAWNRSLAAALGGATGA